jgi:hypothetical protein
MDGKTLKRKHFADGTVGCRHCGKPHKIEHGSLKQHENKCPHKKKPQPLKFSGEKLPEIVPPNTLVCTRHMGLISPTFIQQFAMYYRAATTSMYHIHNIENTFC